MGAKISQRSFKGFALAVLAGGISAALFAFALMMAGSPLFLIVYVTALPLYVAGLGLGVLAGMSASMSSLLGLYSIDPGYATAYSIINAVPTIALISLALRQKKSADGKIVWCPEGHILSAMVVYPCVLFLVVLAKTWDLPGGLLGLTSDTFKGLADKIAETLTADQAVLVHTVLEKSAHFAPCIVGLCWVFTMLISMVAAQAIVQKKNWNIRTAFDLSSLTIPTWMLFATALTGLAAMFAPAPYGYAGLNLSIMLGMPFFFVGLAVIHGLASITKASTPILVGFYIILSVAPWLVLPVAALGVIDQWANFRQRLVVGHKQS